LRLDLAPQVDSQPVVWLERVGVRYRAPEERLSTFKEYAIRRLLRPPRYSDFYALQDVSMQVHRGEVFGIIGRNGAGKSTLLKVVSRVLAPSQGRVRVRGRVAPLLELGAGFHPELTGRENVFLNGTLLGHAHREIEARMDDILQFAELGRFVDAALRTYSSGMVARLGFSVATAWQPEILILDEVLAVGDEAFRAKCAMRMENFRLGGTTILLVTHDMGTVLSMCQRALWLERGRVVSTGPAASVVEVYRRSSPTPVTP
jgi:ABC-2 type transport system ATP-binding protein/lipopolysaccharide transport system ATP-binding protein